ncbi:MAG: alpha/beta hydrolase [Alphaproteobacteria bacterium]|nr:alpha/beta hydrolase [Alphaproteobacteria bacterium]
MYWVLGSVLATYGLVVGGLYAFQRHLLYFPAGERPALGELSVLGVREVQVRTADGLSLLSWYLPPGDRRPVIAYLHGNGGHIGYRAERLRGFARKGYGVLMLEYRGYGGNPGTPSEAGFRADGAAALDFLAGCGIDPDRLVVYGESLGSGVAVALAATRQIGALVLEAPLTSVADVAQYHYSFVPAAALVRDRFDSLSRIGHVKAPILVLHGERDRVVPVRFGRALFEAAPEPKELWIAAQAGHDNLAGFGALEAVRSFVDRRVG